MHADELLKSGDLKGALSALQEDIRGNAADAKLRVFLFQLLAVMGNWKRAITQLKLCGELDPLAVPMAQTYREGIICEVYREKVFAGEKDPLIFGEPAEWIALMIEALKLQNAGQAEQAAELRGKAFELAPMASGTINGERFDWIADADMRLGPVLEIVINGRYFWMPFTSIGELVIEPPEDLRDAVWTPATLTLANGGEVVALIPTRYAGTVKGGVSAELLARSTTWIEVGAETYIGTGQRLLTTSKSDIALMDIRSLKMDPQPVASGAEAEEASGHG